MLSVVCFAMAGTTSSPKFSLVAEIFESMEYGPVSNSSSIAKVCILYFSVIISYCLKIILKYSVVRRSLSLQI